MNAPTSADTRHAIRSLVSAWITRGARSAGSSPQSGAGDPPSLVVQFRRMIPEIDRRLRLDVLQGSLRATINEGTKRLVHTTR